MHEDTGLGGTNKGLRAYHGGLAWLGYEKPWHSGKLCLRTFSSKAGLTVALRFAHSRGHAAYVGHSIA